MTAKRVCVAISVRHGSQSKHVLVGYKDKMWNLREAQAKTLIELIDKLTESKMEVLVSPRTPPHYRIIKDHPRGTASGEADSPSGVLHPPRPRRVGRETRRFLLFLYSEREGGEFGEVYSGYLKRGRERVPVAVKRLKGLVNKDAIKTFLKALSPPLSSSFRKQRR